MEKTPEEYVEMTIDKRLDERLRSLGVKGVRKGKGKGSRKTDPIQALAAKADVDVDPAEIMKRVGTEGMVSEELVESALKPKNGGPPPAAAGSKGKAKGKAKSDGKGKTKGKGYDGKYSPKGKKGKTDAQRRYDKTGGKGDRYDKGGGKATTTSTLKGGKKEKGSNSRKAGNGKGKAKQGKSYSGKW